jgi:putative RecB family exonuclease
VTVTRSGAEDGLPVTRANVGGLSYGVGVDIESAVDELPPEAGTRSGPALELPSGLRLRAYVDRLDVSAAGGLRVVDYKTGKVPLKAYEASALFQMKFYALVIWRLRGAIPRLLQLMYLSGEGEVLRYSPDEADLRATERKLEALWAAISRARETGDFRPRPSRLCDWCRHKALCPSFGGTLPPLPVSVAVAPVAP